MPFTNYFMECVMIQKKYNNQKPIKDGEFKRGLKDRHIQLITLGGIVGSGYFLGTGEIIHQVGPAVFISYLFGGLIVYLTMLCMGELAVAIPISGSFITYASDFISPSVACGIGWSYWVNWVVYIPAECIAGGIIMEYFTGIDGHIWAVLFGLLVTYFNLIEVDRFGEVEFWLSLIKIIALIAFVVIAILIFFGIIHGTRPSEIIGTKYLLSDGGFFPNGTGVLFSTMILLLVNYQGSEIIGIAAGESVNPAKVIPQAIKNVTIRILLIYILPVFFLVLIYPWQKANLDNPVFSDALNYYGLEWAGSITSFIIITSTISCSNSGFYSCVRALNALARNGMAPYKLRHLNHNSVPQNAAIVTLIAVWSLLALSYFFGQSIIYVSFLLVSGFTVLLSWISICWSQINFRKRLYKAGYSADTLGFKTPFTPYTGILAISLMMSCLIFLLFNENESYKIAFAIGVAVFTFPILIYHLNSKFTEDNGIENMEKPTQFDNIFPDISDKSL